MSIIDTREAGIRGDAPANHAGETGSIPVSRSKYQTFDDLTVDSIDVELAREIICSRHYSRKWNTAFGTRNYGIYRGNELLGVAVYGNPMNPGSWSGITDSDSKWCLELNRLWIDDELLSNSETWFLKKTMDALSDEGYQLIQSFADGRLGVGTIYQAANFGYYGWHDTLFHEQLETGEFWHDTPFTNTAVPGGMVFRNLMHARGELKSFRVKTYRYLFPLNKRARRQIKLESLPYPKARDGVIPVPNYQPPMAQIARAVALANRMQQFKNAAILTDYLKRLTADADSLIAEQSENEWVKSIISDTPLFEL